MPRRVRLAASLATALAFATTFAAMPRTAHADKPAADKPAADKPGAEAMERARGHFKQGRAYQEAGAYQRAIAEYLQANELAPRPELLFNIAQCYRLDGQAEPALEYYARYLEVMPDGPGADDSRGYVAALRRQIDAEREESERAAAQRAAAERARASQPPATPGPVAPAPAPRTRLVRSSSPAARWTGIGGVTVGAALLGTGLYFGKRAADTADDLASAPQWDAELAAREEAAQADETRMIWMVSGGSALLLGGALLWWWSGRETHIEAVPEVAKDRAGLLIRGRF